MRQYNEDEIEEIFDKLSNKKKVEVLETALCSIQQANWKTRIYCIAEAMGYKTIGGEMYRYINTKI